MECLYHVVKENLEEDIFSPLYLTAREKKITKEPKKKVIVIAGPTAVGKTQASLTIAQALGGEIISADSMQVYRGMDIGTAKVSDEMQQLLPHHMIDICDIDQNFNVVEFYNRAHLYLKEIFLKEQVPIIVGGSGFYLHALLYGPPQGPPSVIEIRQRLEKQIEELGAGALYERLQMLDPEYAQTITENDKHKIVRALEIITITKRPVSSFPKADKIQNDLYDFRCWFLHMPKEVLYSRADMRCDEMIENGFVEEVQQLEQCGLRENHSAAQAIGYKQCLEFLQTERSEEEKQKFVEAFKKATRNYIKRQITWFRKESSFRWLDIYQIDFKRAIEFILQDYEQK